MGKLIGMIMAGIFTAAVGVIFISMDVLNIRKFGIDFLITGNIRYIIGGVLIVMGILSIASMIYRYKHPVHLEFNEQGVKFYNPKIELVPWVDVISIEKAVDKKQRVLISYSKNTPIRFIIKNKPEYKEFSKVEESSFEILFELLDTDYSTDDLYYMLNEYYKNKQGTEV